MTRPARRIASLLLATLVAAGAAAAAGNAAHAAELPAAPANERMEPLPKDLEGVGIEAKLGATIPLDLDFIDDQGHAVKLGSYFTKGRPVLLDLGYYECPMLCNLVLNAMVEGIKVLPFVPGRDYEIVVVSINPSETHELARAKKASYIRSFERPGTEDGWHFLTGRQAEIDELARAVGFGYRYVAATREYAHGAALFMLTGEGTVSQVLTGIQFDPQTLRLAVVDASRGTVGSALDQVLLFCFHYDASAGRYGWAAERLMKAGGALTALVLGSVLITLWSRDRRRSKAAAARVPEAHA
jgi:protein SCO1/2